MHEAIPHPKLFVTIVLFCQDAVEVRNLSVVYSLAGGMPRYLLLPPLVQSDILLHFLTVNCIDCAAESAVVNAVVEGIEGASDLCEKSGQEFRKPWIMISISDDEDPHFRKAGWYYYSSNLAADE